VTKRNKPVFLSLMSASTRTLALLAAQHGEVSRLCSRAFARRHLVPADGSAGLAHGGSCHAHTVNSCPTSAAGGSDLRDHAVRLRNRRRGHSLCRYCNRYG